MQFVFGTLVVLDAFDTICLPVNSEKLMCA